MRQPPSLDARFRANLHALGLAERDAHVLVALSGGADSVLLLHLFRFSAADLGIRLSAAHFDHAMRPESAADARWCAGLCTAWEIPFVTRRSDRPLRTEEEARDARYAFLRAARDEVGGTWIATAHHADDQAETVLFRVLRGTGISGLAGIPERDEAAGIVRPLLPFWRAELRRHARAHRLRWREDATNRLVDPARNRIRLEILPRIERSVAPGARRALVRLAALAREEEGAWERLLEAEMRALAHEEDGAVVLVRERLAGYDSPLAARLLRAVLRRSGLVLSRTGTRSALRFICEAPSGRRLVLPGGVAVSTEFGAARIERIGAPDPPDVPLEIAGEAGSGRCVIGGRERRIAWRAVVAEEVSGGPAAPVLRLDGLPAPLLLRGWRPGDRMRTPSGTKTLKKLFNEARVPVSARRRAPVLADARGAVVWVGGVGQGGEGPRPGERALTLFIEDA